MARSRSSQTFVYYFTRAVEEVRIIDKYLGAFHGIELPFVFDLPEGYYFIFMTPGEKQLQHHVVRCGTGAKLPLFSPLDGKVLDAYGEVWRSQRQWRVK